MKRKILLDNEKDMKIFLRIMLSVCLFLPVTAWGVLCSGEVMNSYISVGGNLIIKPSWRNDYTKLCNVNDEPIVCSLWSGYVTTSMNDNTSLIVSYSNEASCSNLSTYSSAPTPDYVMLKAE